MSTVQSIHMDLRLKRALAQPEETVAAQPALWRSLDGRRLWLGLLDTAQIALLGPLLASYTEQLTPFRTVKMLALGLVVAGLTSIIRSGLLFFLTPAHVFRTGIQPLTRPVLTATLGTAITFSLLGLAMWLLGVAQTLMPIGLYLWAGISIVFTAAIHLAVLLTLENQGTGIVVLGPPGQTEAPERNLAAHDCSPMATLVDDDHSLDEIERMAAVGMLRAVVLTHAAAGQGRITEICRRLSDTDVRICRYLSADSLGIESVTAQSHVLIDLLPPPLTERQLLAKRAFDIGLSVAALAILGPLLVLSAIAIKIDSPGPVIFRQWRFGLGGRPTQVYKFRTMRNDLCDSTGAARTTARDARVTRVGRILRRTSIDELPQILNVLRGEMSLVGPRPHPTHMKIEGVFYFDAVSQYRTRHRFKPGITGWAQINGSRGEVDTIAKARRRVDLDLWYLSNWSPALDLWIVLRTALGGFATFRAD